MLTAPVEPVADDSVSEVGPLVLVVAAVSVPLIDPPVVCVPIPPVGVSVALIDPSVGVPDDPSLMPELGLVPGVVMASDAVPPPLSPQPNSATEPEKRTKEPAKEITNVRITHHPHA